MLSRRCEYLLLFRHFFPQTVGFIRIQYSLVLFHIRPVYGWAAHGLGWAYKIDFVNRAGLDQLLSSFHVLGLELLI